MKLTVVAVSQICIEATGKFLSSLNSSRACSNNKVIVQMLVRVLQDCDWEENV